jgi:nitrate reductase gamma subunit
VGLLTIPVSIYHAINGDASVMVSLAEWAQSVISLQANAVLLSEVGWLYKLHLFLGMSVFLFFPFTRLVHVWSAPFAYLIRPYQIVRRKYVRYR